MAQKDHKLAVFMKNSSAGKSARKLKKLSTFSKIHEPKMSSLVALA